MNAVSEGWPAVSRGFGAYGLKLLVVGCALCTFGMSASLFGLSIRPGHLLAVLLGIATMPLAAVAVADGRVRQAPFLLGLWLMVALVSSTLAVDHMTSLRHWLDLTLAVALFFLALSWKLERVVLTRPAQLLWIGMALAGGGIIMFILQSTGMIAPGSILSLFVGSPYGYPRVSMTMLEPNLYGATMMIFALAFLPEWRLAGIVKRIAIVLLHIGMLLSFSKGPLVGYAIGVAMYFLCKKNRGKAFLYMFAAMIVIGLLTLLIADNSVDTSFLSRMDAIYSRFIYMEFAWRDILHAPFIGNGIYSFGALNTKLLWAYTGGKGLGSQAWLGSLPLAVLHDTGLVGFSLLAAFFISIIRKGYRAILTERHVIGTSALTLDRAAGWLSAGVAILVSSMATTAHAMGIFWVLFAIIYSIPTTLGAARAVNPFFYGMLEVRAS